MINNKSRRTLLEYIVQLITSAKSLNRSAVQCCYVKLLIHIHLFVIVNIRERIVGEASAAMDAQMKLEPFYRRMNIRSQAVRAKAEELVRILDFRAPTGINGNVR